MKLSLIIPSYKDPLLCKTIASFLGASELGNDLEIIAVLDGYWPDEVYSDPRVRYIHLGKNRQMRGAINAGVSIARGEYLMKSDEHCNYAPGFDRVMVENCRSNWVMTPLRYALDINTWENMPGEPTGYEKLVIVDDVRFAGVRWRYRDRARKNIPIDENMAFQGSCWLMSRKWWDEVVGPLQIEGYGPFYQEAPEICFKTWQAGGRLVLNKRTWYSHKHRSFGRNHRTRASASWAYALNTWRNYYESDILPRFQ